MAWVEAMSSIRSRAEKIVKYEMIYSPVGSGM